MKEVSFMDNNSIFLTQRKFDEVWGRVTGAPPTDADTLKELMKYEYIDWWLYELGDKVIELADGSQTWDLTTPEALYDYIVNVCN